MNYHILNGPSRPFHAVETYPVIYVGPTIFFRFADRQCIGRQALLCFPIGPYSA